MTVIIGLTILLIMVGFDASISFAVWRIVGKFGWHGETAAFASGILGTLAGSLMLNHLFKGYGKRTQNP